MNTQTITMKLSSGKTVTAEYVARKDISREQFMELISQRWMLIDSEDLEDCEDALTNAIAAKLNNQRFVYRWQYAA